MEDRVLGQGAGEVGCWRPDHTELSVTCWGRTRGPPGIFRGAGQEAPLHHVGVNKRSALSSLALLLSMPPAPLAPLRAHAHTHAG